MTASGLLFPIKCKKNPTNRPENDQTKTTISANRKIMHKFTTLTTALAEAFDGCL
jgi:hypothetical protein